MKLLKPIWDKHKEDNLTQLVFSDLSVPSKDFNIYDDIRSKLIKMGVPENEIDFVHSAGNNKQKDKLFKRVRNGELRILLGSTGKMGEGTNAQNKLIAIHDLDVPWRPSDLEQRSGRIVRQGNENKNVYIYRYITENTFDGYLWQMIERKQKFISQVFTSKTPVRTMEEIDEATLNYAELKALSTGNPFIREKMDLDLEVSRLKMLESNFKSNIYKLEDKVYKTYPKEIKDLGNKIEYIKKDIENLEPYNTGDSKFTSLTLDGKKYTDKKLAAEFLLHKIKAVKISDSKETKLGEYRNFELFTKYNAFSNKYEFTLKGNTNYYGEFGTDSIGNITRLDNVLDKMPERLENTINKLDDTKNLLENAKIEMKKEFPDKDLLKEKSLRLAEINNLIELGEDNDFKQSDPLLDEVKKEIIEFLNEEYEEGLKVTDFDEKYPDLTDVGIAFTTTPDDEHTISASFDLVNYKLNQYVDDTLVNSYQYTYDKNDSSDVKELIKIKDEISLSTFNDFIDINEEQLFNTLSLAISDDGNFYDPLAKDLDNDGIIDRYDNDFKDSDYLESNFDIDGFKKDEKPSVMASLEHYKKISKKDNEKVEGKEYNSEIEYEEAR